MIKFILAFVILLSTSSISFCQDSTSALPVFQFVEESPEFPGGIDALMDFLKSNIHYPQQAADKGIAGRVYASFVVDTNGNVVQVKILRGIEGLNEEALRVVKAMPKWSPGRIKGKAVQVQYNLPIVFSLANVKSTGEPKNKFGSYLDKANEYYETGNFEMAIVYYTKAIKENNVYSDPYFKRGNCFNELGFANSACSDWRKAKDLGSSATDSKTLDSCFMVDLKNQFQSHFEFIDDGDAGFVKYINDNLEYPELAKTYSIQGTVKVNLKVDSLGSLTDAKVNRGIGGGCDEEALRLIRSIKLWKPGYKDGIAVASEALLPVRFKLKK